MSSPYSCRCSDCALLLLWLLDRLVPSEADLRAASTCHDLRHLKAQQAPDDDEKLLVRLWKHGVELSVMTTPVEAEGWAWGVDGLFAVLQANDEGDLSPEEAAQLARGEVVMSMDRDTGKVVLRARPAAIASSAPPPSSHSQAEARAETLLQDTLYRALQKADAMGLQGFAIVPPDTATEFTQGGGMSEARIRSLTVSFVVEYVRSHSLQALKRIVMLDVLPPTESTSTGPAADQHKRHSMMAEALCRSTMCMDDINVSKCNDDRCRVILGKQAPERPVSASSTTTSSSSKGGSHSVLLKGTKECLEMAVQEIKLAISDV